MFLYVAFPKRRTRYFISIDFRTPSMALHLTIPKLLMFTVHTFTSQSYTGVQVFYYYILDFAHTQANKKATKVLEEIKNTQKFHKHSTIS